MGRVRKGDTTAPTETDDSVLLLGSGEGHSVLSNGIKLFLNPGRIEGSYRGGGQRCQDAVRAIGKVLHRQKVGRDGDEAIGGELVGNAADPGGKSEDLVNDDHHRSLRATLRIDNPDADAVSTTCVDDGVLTVAGRGAQAGDRTGGVSREPRVIRRGDSCLGWSWCGMIGVRVGGRDHFVCRARCGASDRKNEAESHYFNLIAHITESPVWLFAEIPKHRRTVARRILQRGIPRNKTAAMATGQI
jgi:hypothetical protein